MQANNISNHIEELVKSASMQTFYNPAISKLRQSKKISNFEMIEGMRELDSFVSSSNYVYSAYVYNRARDYIYASATSPIYSDSTEKFLDPNALSLLHSISPEQRLTPLYRSIPKKGSQDSEPVFTFFTYEENSGSFDSALIINVKAEWINQLLFRIHSADGMMVITPNGQVIASSSAQECEFPALGEPQYQKIFASPSTDGYFIDYSGNEKYIYLYSQFSNNEWYFVRVIPYNECMLDISSMKTKTSLILSMVFLTGLIVSLLLLMRIYLPFRHILHSLSRVSDGEPENVGSILKNLDFLVDDAIQADKTKQSYVCLLKSEFLKQLLYGPIPKFENIVQNFNSFAIRLLPKEHFYLIVVQGSGLADYEATIQDENSDLIIEGVYIAGKSIFLLQTPHPEQLCDICQNLNRRHGVLAAYSSPVTECRNLKRCYTRMLEVIAFRIFLPDCKVLSESMLDQKLKDNIYPDKIEQNLVNALRNGKVEPARDQFELMRDLMLDYRFNTIVFAFKRLYLTVFSIYRDVFHLEETTFQPNMLEMLDEKFHSTEDFNEIAVLFYDLFDKIAEQVDSNRQNRNQKLIESVCSHIEKKYNDPTLSPQMVSDEFGLSSAYLGRLFRSSKDISISEYINQVRIKHAKDMLLASNLPIKDIAERVGFANSQYFYTLFKNDSQQTPKEYRISTRENLRHV